MLIERAARVGSERMADKEHNRRFLWWVAGADQKILSDCPKGDQVFIQHLGISLIVAFFFVWLATSTAVVIAFPNLTPLSYAIAMALALLIAISVFLIDRLFIQADWDWQARSQQEEMAKSAWEKDTEDTEKVLPAFHDTGGRFGRRVSRILYVGARLLLSAAIGFSVASFLELVIYKDEVAATIERLHYEENAAIYDNIDTRADILDAEIGNAQAERNRLQKEVANLESEIAHFVSSPPRTPSNQRIEEITNQINGFRDQLSAERSENARNAQQMICERYGTEIDERCSGLQGEGVNFYTARDLKALSDARIEEYESEIASLLEQREQLSAQARLAAAEDEDRHAAMLSAMRDQLAATTFSRDAAHSRFNHLSEQRDARLEAFSETLKGSPDFIPISFGAASQFRALSHLYWEYGIFAEQIMIKMLIMLIELTPVLQKILMSPNTLYAVKLDSARKLDGYDHLGAVIAAKREHLRRKFDVAFTDQMDADALKRHKERREGGVTELRKGA